MCNLSHILDNDSTTPMRAFKSALPTLANAELLVRMLWETSSWYSLMVGVVVKSIGHYMYQVLRYAEAPSPTTEIMIQSGVEQCGESEACMP